MRSVSSPRIKAGVFVLEGINAVATTYYFYYVYFFLKETFGATDLQNLLLAAGLGLVYAIAAALGGKFSQRFGYFLGLRVGFIVMTLCTAAAGTRLPGGAQVLLLIVCTIGMCFTWPTLEALVSEHESPASLPTMIGVYNLVWAGGGALAYFTGGAIQQAIGWHKLFLIAAVLHAFQVALTMFLERAQKNSKATSNFPREAEVGKGTSGEVDEATAKSFLRLGWLSNPFAYLAINTLIPIIPSLAGKLSLSPMVAGFVYSTFFFARTLSFLVLWKWTAWHYKFRWLVAAFVAMIASFVGICSVANLWLLIGAQIIFGFAVGLIYYSSLYYSMDVGDTKGEHGGLHEAVIGLGSFAGPAVGAASLHFAAGKPGISIIAVAALLSVGFIAMVVLFLRNPRPDVRNTRRHSALPQP